MTSERDTEEPLSPAEVREILRVCSPGGLLVGGQALAFWADFLAVALPSILSSGVSSDADFIGDVALARKLARALRWTEWVPSLDDATPHTAKVTKRAPGGGVKQVDFLSGVAGLDTQDLERRALNVEIPEIGRARIIHPIDVLASRIQNLHLLAHKRTKAGVAQALLAVDVVRAFIRHTILVHGERAALKLLERVVTIAGDTAALRVHLKFDSEPLNAVPLDDFRTTPALHGVRWPDALAEIAAKRQKLRSVPTRRKKGSK
jgi:hypothetical protein